MLDFTPVRAKKMKISQLAAGLTKADLARLTNEMVDAILSLIAACTDADVTFTPDDPQANDTYASSAAEVNLPWTLGHVIVHTTASSEESAFLAAELARGVPFHGRSRHEVPWETVTTIAQCRQRLEESRRIRLASLELWPDPPDLTNSYEVAPGADPTNALTRFVRGLSHDDSHLGQIAEIVRQAKAARERVKVA
ncbi:MAG: DinB family protein [Anaerolineae bacterium]|nr:DinB family protein [Anaerolineales bacterium]MCQ3977338.1 DinB family protein [Anaerolineae bacterium]